MPRLAPCVPLSSLLHREFYLGWFTNWGEALPVTNTTLAAQQLEHILSINASINFYVRPHPLL